MDSSLDSPRGGVGDRVYHFDYLLGKLTSGARQREVRSVHTKSSCRNRPRMDVVSEGLELAPFDSRRDATRQASVPMVFSALRGISLVLQLVFLSFCSSYGV